jgi:hypothetical protein
MWTLLRAARCPCVDVNGKRRGIAMRPAALKYACSRGRSLCGARRSSVIEEPNASARPAKKIFAHAISSSAIVDVHEAWSLATGANHQRCARGRADRPNEGSESSNGNGARVWRALMRNGWRNALAHAAVATRAYFAAYW